MQLKKNTKKQNKNCIQNLEDQLIINNEESTELDHNIRNYIFNVDTKNGLKEYIILELKNTERYKKDTSKNVEKKCKKIAGDYLENNKNCKQWGLTLLRKNKLSKEITNKTGAIALIMFGSTLR